MSLVTGSRTCQAGLSIARGSRTLRWWRRRQPPRSVLSGSALFPALRKTRGLWIAIAAGVSVVALAVAPGSRLLVCALLLSAAVSYARPLVGVAGLPLALMWSPKVPLWIASGEGVFVRLDHAVVAGILLSMMSEKRPREGGMAVPLLLLLCALAASALAGILRGTAPAPMLTLLYLGQMCHLALVFVLAYHFGRHLGPPGAYAWALPLVALAMFGIVEALAPASSMPVHNDRTFERVWFHGQANHVGGLLAFGAAVGVALLREPRWRCLGATLALLACLALAGTRSREGMAALAAALWCLAFCRFPLAATAALVLAGLGLLMLPDQTWSGILSPGSSLYARVVHWKGALSSVTAHPVLGLGLGARHRQFYDNQYLMMLAEGGLLSLVAFAGWLAVLMRALWQGSGTRGLGGALCCGAFAGLVGVAVQSGAAVCFVVTILAGPVYWLAGYALSFQEETPPPAALPDACAGSGS